VPGSLPGPATASFRVGQCSAVAHDHGPLVRLLDPGL
jgi:hypothetical protein